MANIRITGKVKPGFKSAGGEWTNITETKVEWSSDSLSSVAGMSDPDKTINAQTVEQGKTKFNIFEVKGWYDVEDIDDLIVALIEVRKAIGHKG